MEIVFDQINGKNISKILNNGVKSTIIVSPYISNIDEILDIEKSDSSRIICNAAAIPALI